MTKNKSFMTVLLSILLVLSMIIPSIPVSAAVVTSSDGLWKYNKLSDTTVEITGYTGSLTTFNIPSTIDDLTVVSIGQSAFQRNSKISAIVIPEGVTEIQANAFANCYNLRAVSIPKSVVVIGKDAFLNTPYLSVMLNSAVDGITYINGLALGYDNTVSEVSIKYGTTEFGTIFQDSNTLTGVSLPNTITKIDDFAFLGCTSLRYVIIPDTVYDISQSAFLGLNPSSFVILCSQGSYARSYAIANGYRYDEIPTYPYLINSYVNYDKYSKNDLSVNIFLGNGLKGISSISSATIKNSYLDSSATVTKEVEASIVKGSNNYTNSLVISNDVFRDLSAGTYYITLKTPINYDLSLTVTLTDTTPSGTAPTTTGGSQTIDLAKASDVSIYYNYGTLNSKATSIKSIKIGEKTLTSSEYTIYSDSVKIYKSAFSNLAEGNHKVEITFDDVRNTKTNNYTVIIKDSSKDIVESTDIELNVNFKYTTVNGYYTLKPTVYPSNATDKTVEYTSSDTSIATVDANGKVVAKSVGTVVITATNANGQKDRCVIIVKNVPKISKTAVTVTKGKTTKLTISNRYSWAKTTVTSSNSSVATASTDGTITAKKAGTTTITWSINQCGRIYKISSKVTVK